jgi:uncharacterized Zn-finger protein
VNDEELTMHKRQLRGWQKINKMTTEVNTNRASCDGATQMVKRHPRAYQDMVKTKPHGMSKCSAADEDNMVRSTLTGPRVTVRHRWQRNFQELVKTWPRLSHMA